MMKFKVLICCFVLFPHMSSALNIVVCKKMDINYSLSVSQRKKFDHTNIRKSDLIDCYQRYLHVFEISATSNTGKKTDLMMYLINNCTYQELAQFSMNAWYAVHKEGVDYTYNVFKRKHNISKEKYLVDIDYLEILSSFYEIILDAYANS